MHRPSGEVPQGRRGEVAKLITLADNDNIVAARVTKLSLVD